MQTLFIFINILMHNRLVFQLDLFYLSLFLCLHKWEIRYLMMSTICASVHQESYIEVWLTTPIHKAA